MTRTVCDPATLTVCVGPCGRLTHSGRVIRTCPEGHPPGRGRGLCTGCYQAASRGGTLADYPRTTWAATDLLDEWEQLRVAGVELADFPARVGVSFATWERAFLRAQAAGDARAVRSGAGR